MSTAPDWFQKHIDEDKKSFGERPTKDEMRQIIDAALIDFFTSKGILTKNVLVTTATIIGALIVIGGGIKWFLGLLGVGFIIKQ